MSENTEAQTTDPAGIPEPTPEQMPAEQPTPPFGPLRRAEWDTKV